MDEMIALDLKNLWVQVGLINMEAAAKAESAGISVVMNRCVLIQHRRLTG
ncbi:MAG: CoA-binding protein [Bryocella sp.]